MLPIRYHVSRIGAVLLLTLALAGCTPTEQSTITGADYFTVPVGEQPPGTHPTGRNPLTVPFEETP